MQAAARIGQVKRARRGRVCKSCCSCPCTLEPASAPSPHTRSSRMDLLLPALMGAALLQLPPAAAAVSVTIDTSQVVRKVAA